MKTIADLKAIREAAKAQVELRKDKDGYRVVVGMATCGIAAGARPVMARFVERIQSEGIDNAVVTQTGCIGVCRLEPIVEIYNPDGEKTTYTLMTPEKADEVIDSHIKKGQPVVKYVIGATEGR
jgi:NADP-reducing hydrogenase subunit HndB